MVFNLYLPFQLIVGKYGYISHKKRISCADDFQYWRSTSGLVHKGQGKTDNFRAQEQMVQWLYGYQDMTIEFE